MKNERTIFEREWFGNLAFYFGQQWVQWLRTGTNVYAELKVPVAPPWRVRLVSNKIKPMVRKELARLTKERPTGAVIPASTEDKDIMAAASAEQIREHLWRELKMNRLLRRTLFWTVLTGNGYVKDYWDPSAKDSDGSPGRIICEPVSPFHLFAGDLQEETIEGQPLLLHVSVKPTSWVKSVYGVDIKAEGKNSSPTWEAQLLKGLNLQNAEHPGGTVQIKEAWIKQAPFLKDGGRVVWAGGQVISIDEGLPYAYNDYPFTKFEHIETGRFYSQSFISDLIPLQKEYNRTRSQIIEAKNRMAKPQLIAQKGAVDTRRMTSEPGLIIEFTPGMLPPQPLPLQALPGYVAQELDRNIMDMNDIASQHEITKGQSPPGVEAATAISFLQEQDDSAISNALSSVEEGVERISKHLLSHVVEFWEVPRMVRVSGVNYAVEASELKGSDINGATDWTVVNGSATPRSIAAKQAFITDLMKNQFINPELGLRYLGIAETDSIYQDLQIDTREAQHENILMSRIEPPAEEELTQKANAILQAQQQIPEQSRLQPVQIANRALLEYVMPLNSSDNHISHVLEHERFQKTQQFKLLPKILQQINILHTKMHMQAWAAETGIQLDLEDPRLVGVFKGHGAPPPMSIEDAPQLPPGGQVQNG